MKQAADKYQREVEFQKDDLVFLKFQLYRQTYVFKRAHQKLANRFFGLYRVLKKIGSVAYKLQLLEGASIHLVFHVSLLKKVMGNLTHNNIELSPIDDDSVIILEPDSIIDTRWLK